MTLTLIDRSDDLPIPIEEIRTSLRIEHDTEDSVIVRAFWSAAEFFEDETNRAITIGTYEVELDAWPCGPLVLERAPLRRVISVSYLGRDATDFTDLDPETFDVGKRGDGLSELRIVGGWPHGTGLASRLGCVKVQFEAGYSPQNQTESDRRFRLPSKIEQALILLTGHWFENREESSDRENRAIIMGAERILKQSRIWR